MRHGALKVIKPVKPLRKGGGRGRAPFMMQVADDDGSFLVIGSRWVRERWAGAAPVEPSTREQLRTVERLMLCEADRRRHEGDFDLNHPMVLDDQQQDVPAPLIMRPSAMAG